MEQQGPVPVGDDVGSAGEGDHRPGAPGQAFGQLCRLGQRLLGNGVPGGYVHPAAAPLPQGQGADLGSIAADDGKAKLRQQAAAGLPPQRGGSGGHRVQYHGDSKGVGRFSGQEHGLQLPDGSQVEHQSLDPRDRFFHLAEVVGHGGRSAGGQDHVGAVVDGDKVGNALYQGRGAPHRPEPGGKFGWLHRSLPLNG